MGGLLAPFLFSAHLTAFNFGDIYTYHYPLRHMAAERLQSGELPLWNPYWFAGMPLWANPQTSVLYPLSLPFQFFPVIQALNITVFLHLGLAALGCVLLFRRLGVSPAGAFTLAAAYVLSPFVLGRLAQGVPTLLAALAWIPWTWLALGTGRLPLLAATLALQGLSGHPQFMAANLAGLAVHAAFQRRLRLVVTAAAWGGLMDLLQAWPTAELLSRSVRAHWNAAFAAGYSLPWSGLASFLSPIIGGSPWTDYARLPSVWFETAVGYIGLVPLALAGAGLFVLSREKRAPLLANLALGVVMALGLVPVSLFRAPARFLILVLWALVLAAAAGWRFLGPRVSSGWKLAALLLTVLDLGLYGARLVQPQDARPFTKPDFTLLEPIRPGWRIATDPDLANPDKLGLYHVSNAAGYEAVYLEGAAVFASRSEGHAAAEGSRTFITRVDTPQMEALGVRYYLTPRDLGEAGLVAKNHVLRLYENPAALASAHYEDGLAAKAEELGPELWKIHAPGAGRLVFSVPDYPGWRAWIEGRPAPVERWRDFLMSVEAPGRSVIDVSFAPRGWLLLVLVSLAAWLFAAAGAARGLRRSA